MDCIEKYMEFLRREIEWGSGSFDGGKIGSIVKQPGRFTGSVGSIVGLV
jgi:hypothetical protein